MHAWMISVSSMHVCMNVWVCVCTAEIHKFYTLQLGRLVSFHMSTSEWHASRVKSARCCIPFKAFHWEPGFPSRSRLLVTSSHSMRHASQGHYSLPGNAPTVLGQLQPLSRKAPTCSLIFAHDLCSCISAFSNLCLISSCHEPCPAEKQPAYVVCLMLLDTMHKHAYGCFLLRCPDFEPVCVCSHRQKLLDDFKGVST